MAEVTAYAAGAGTPVSSFQKPLTLSFRLTPVAGVAPSVFYLGLIAGYEDYTFRPQALLSRAEMAVLVTRVLRFKGVKVEAPSDRAFTDQEGIPAWAAPAIRTAAAAGLLGGFPDGSFQPGGPATRAQAAAVSRRLLGNGGR